MDEIATHLLVSAQIRRAAQEGVSIIPVKRGDPQSGALLLKINLLNGTARLLTQVRDDEELGWCPVGPSDPMPDREADLYCERQAEFDPDLWLIEIEDKQGRLWFPGKEIKS